MDRKTCLNRQKKLRVSTKFNQRPLPAPLRTCKRRLLKGWKQWQDFQSMAEHFLPYIRKNIKHLILAQLAGLSYIILGLLEPWPLKLIFDNIFLNQPLPLILSPVLGTFAGKPFLFLNILIIAIIMIALIRGVFYYYQRLLTSRAGQQISASVRVGLYSHLQSLSFSFHDYRRTGDLLSRLTTDIRILREILISLPLTIVTELCLMLGMLTVMFIMDWQLSLIALAVVPMLVLLLKRYQLPMKSAIRKQRKREGHLASIASEVLGAIKIVQGFHQEHSEVERFTTHNKSSLRSGLRAARLEAKFKWASELAVALVTAIVLGVAARRVLSGALSPGDILVFVAYLKTFNRPLRRISRLSERTARGTASGERILNMLRIEPLIRDGVNAVRAQRIQGEVTFKDVSFKYRNGPLVLTDISFHINSGERVAITGPTGCGKSTLASLLPRFYDPVKGAVLVDGKDIQNFTISSLRRNITLVFQEPVLFATTIAENIAYGKPDASREEIKNAAKRARIHEVIEALPEKYETVLGERGGTISGGQRQCVSIARAIIKNTPIVILDEPTSGLDSQSAELVMGALRKLMQGKTIIIISHQIETISDVDRVLVLQRGSLIHEGT
ncbi:MAG: ABC transporter ATP-binding protein, partial [Thermodesulfovibrionia bacterium]|nr:ABC transporter ATP-binding protein [Thermodesulfovibrionia bacterium]